MSQTFASGQRWISMTEPELGLGLIVDVESRRVGIYFPAADEERSYAIDNAPLSRVIFEAGDAITLDDDQRLRVREVQSHNDCLVYLAENDEGHAHPVPEQLLGPIIQLNSARDRLLGGQVDDPRRFMLRARTLDHRNRARAAGSRGLLGPRVDLIPHQFYIARQALRREHPRLLLADEVGLGKTIEAGLILHQLYLEERVKRVLILVPDSLVHQWLVEMRRRFNLAFSIFDEERCRELDPSRNGDETVFFDEDAEQAREHNPFDSEQLLIASIDWLADNEKRQRQILDTEWDLLIVDEAHHLHWSREGESSTSYRFVEALCNAIPAALLLTATPESAGIEAHFARLRLLDPQRYGNFDAFVEEQNAYNQISERVQEIAADPEQAARNADTLALLDKTLAAQFRQEPQTHQHDALNALLDRFGTGRSLFRNSRSAVGGFPARELHEHPLSASNDQPVLQSDDWPAHDPRVQWLEQFLLQRPEERALLICAERETARSLELYLRLRRGIASAVFHEEMTLFERDRAAAYFADNDSGAQLLVCSEIGSEGRNFQFAEHLILFDLPDNPDLLEQRIGRLDRIGRTQNVLIHIPFISNSPTERLLSWYRDALKIFEQPCTIGMAMVEAFGEDLKQVLQGEGDIQALIERAAPQADSWRQALHSGRNRLLELNSCRPGEAREIVDNLASEQESDALADYLEQVADQFGLEHEHHSEQTIILRPGDHMLTERFPHLPEEGLSGTFDRKRALAREDLEFLSWEHPLVRATLDTVLNGDFGSACVSTLSVKGLPPGSLLLEAFLNPQVAAPIALQLDRYFPAMSARLLLDTEGRDLAGKVSHEQLNTLCQPIKRKLIPAVLRQIREPLGKLLDRVEGAGDGIADEWRQQALTNYRDQRTRERERLAALAQINPDVDTADIARFEAQSAQGEKLLERLQLNPVALRLAIVR